MGIRVANFASSRRGALVALCLALVASSGALADPFPPGAQAEHVKQIGFSALGGRFGGFKIAIRHTANDKWYLYTGHSFDQGWSIVDVTDPTKPRYVKFIPFVSDNKGIITSQVTLHDNLMITSLDRREPAPGPDIIVWDISDPENPKQVSQWGDGTTGAHRNSYPGGKYAYLTTSYPGFKARIFVILDVSDPAHPKEVGKWWQPGQKDGEPPGPSAGFHGPANISPDGKMAVLPYMPDVVNLDISDPTNPKLIGKLQITPPFASVGAQSVHSVMPLWDRKLLYVSSEALKERCEDFGMNFAGMVDNSNPAKPQLISIFPTPRPPKGAPYRDFCEKGGRFGPHNTSQEIHNPAIQQPGNLISVAWFNAGLRIFDISDPRLPTEVGYFMPPERPDLPRQEGAHASKINWSEELAVDARGNIFMNDDKWGLFVLRYTGKEPVAKK